MGDSLRQARAQARRERAILRKSQLRPREEDLTPLRGAEAVSLVHTLTMEGWSLARRELPSYSRDRMPYRFVPGRLT
jgi:hypothetical protein